LSTRDLNARILTREFSHHFIAVVAQCADEISATASDPTVQSNALRWEIAAANESERAATRIAPMTALLDSWTLANQMQAFRAPGGPGGALFGAQQPCAVAVANSLDGEALELAHRLLAPAEFARYQRFVRAFTQEHPLQDLQLLRPSVLESWTASQGSQTRLIDSLGTIP